MNDSFDDNYNFLAQAIVELTANDYRELRRNERENECYSTRWRIHEIERFFLSEYGDLLCHDLGEVILEKLKAEFD